MDEEKENERITILMIFISDTNRNSAELKIPEYTIEYCIESKPHGCNNNTNSSVCFTVYTYAAAASTSSF